MLLLAVALSATGDYRLPEKAFVVADTPGYNSWPMIQEMGGKLVCSYSRDNARPKDGHRIDPGSRDSYVRVSSDGGRTWSPERTVADDPFPMQVMDPVAVRGLGLVSPWFAGSYRKGGSNSWGILVSTDDGHTWTQRVIEDGLSVKEWVTEPSLVDLGGGRLLKRRVVAEDFIFDRPDVWPAPEVLDRGFETRPHDAGNVKATRLGDTDCCAWYSGTPSNATVVVTIVPKPKAVTAAWRQWTVRSNGFLNCYEDWKLWGNCGDGPWKLWGQALKSACKYWV